MTFRHRRHAALLLSLALLAFALLAPPLTAKPQGAPTPAEQAEADMIKRFEPLALEDALIDQQSRIQAAIAALPPHPAGAETVTLAIGGQGYQAIFDREARRAAAILAARAGGPAVILSNTPEQVKSGILAAPRTADLTLAALAKRARPGDTLIVYLTSHGGEDASIAMDAPYLEFAPLTAAALAKSLETHGFGRRIIINSACFAASWIPALASPTTIIIAAAAPDRTSFGCDDSRDLTVFGQAMLAELAVPTASLETAFTQAKQRITTAERAERATPSLPQASIGAAMQSEWSSAPRP